MTRSLSHKQNSQEKTTDSRRQTPADLPDTDELETEDELDLGEIFTESSETTTVALEVEVKAITG